MPPLLFPLCQMIHVKGNWELKVLSQGNVICLRDVRMKTLNTSDCLMKKLKNLIDTKSFDPWIKIPKENIPNKKIITLGTIFIIKCDAPHKAHVVCKEECQPEGTFWNIMTVNNKMPKIWTFNINDAFLYAEPKKEIYNNYLLEKDFVIPLKEVL